MHVPDDAALLSAYVWWGRHHHDLETFRPYLGRTVRMTVWAKSEDLSDRAGLDFQPKARNVRHRTQQRPALQHDPNRPEDVLQADADEDGIGGDDSADALRYLVATKAREVRARKLRGV